MYLLVCVEERADGAVWRFGAHALVVLSLFLHVWRFALPQVSQRFGPALPFQTTLLHWGGLLWSFWDTKTHKLTYNYWLNPWINAVVSISTHRQHVCFYIFTPSFQWCTFFTDLMNICYSLAWPHCCKTFCSLLLEIQHWMLQWQTFITHTVLDERVVSWQLSQIIQLQLSIFTQLLCSLLDRKPFLSAPKSSLDSSL